MSWTTAGAGFLLVISAYAAGLVLELPDRTWLWLIFGTIAATALVGLGLVVSGRTRVGLSAFVGAVAGLGALALAFVVMVAVLPYN